MARTGEHAVVLGASLAGLLTARVLTESFDRVTLVDRDELDEGPVPRRGVPQGWHGHGLHARGREVFEELFPGLTDELVAHGASVGDVQADVRWINDGHRLRKQHSGMRGIAFTRPLLEDRVRNRVRSLPQVTLRSPVEVLDLTSWGDRVTGVRVRDRGTEGNGEALAADLVVDATGRGSHMPGWLESLGFPRPAESSVEVRVGYSTWFFPREAGDLGGDFGVIITPTADNQRFGVALAAEGDRWQVTAGGYLGTTASATDVASFRAFAATLPAPDIGELVAGKQPLGTGRLHRFASSRRRHYEKLRRFPRGLLVIGDALSSFNPTYGQGMTVAAVQALTLREELAAAGEPADLAPRFFRRAARVIDVPWGIAAGGDLRLPGVPGRRPPKVRVINAYVGRVQAAAAVDPAVGLAFLRVANTVDQPEALLRPAVAARVLRATMSRRREDAAAARTVGRQARPEVPRPRRAAETDEATTSSPASAMED